MPKLLPIVMQVAADKGEDLTFSQCRYIARRMEKRCESWLVIDPLAYVLQFWDETGEEATDNVMAERAEANRKAAERRVAA